jgi:SAM-dependent methyltransferase
MEALDGIDDASADAVISTMSLHHLPDEATLQLTMREARRVLKPGGGIFIVDFGRIKREAGQSFFANDRKAVQPEVYTKDYYDSMRAAFSLSDLRNAASILGAEANIKRTFLVPFLVVICSAGATPGAAAQQAAKAFFASLTRRQRYDFRDLVRFFAHGGYPLAFKPW